MPVPRVCVLRAPGTNCDNETAHAFRLCGAKVDTLHLFRLLESPATLLNYQVLCVPGGFSYGDDIGAGVVLAHALRTTMVGIVDEFLRRDTLTLGICNGFQVLLKAGILPEWEGGNVDERPRSATLTWNDNGRYTAKWVRLEVSSAQCRFLEGLDEIDLPIAHAEGRFLCSDASLEDFESRQQLALRYADANGVGTSFTGNPNGSVGRVAGVTDPTGRVLGLMPHPERYIFATQHPHWTRQGARDQSGDGLALFRNAVRSFTS